MIDDLLWSVATKTDPEDRKCLNQILPRLIKSLKAGMERAGVDAQVRNEFMTKLASVHISSVSGAVHATDPDDAEAGSDTGQWLVQEQPTVQETVDEPEEEVEEIILESTPEPIAQDDEYVQEVMAMDLGDWVELLQEDGTYARSRFTWFSPESGRYLFTTRKGEKAAEMTLAGLATEFRRKGARGSMRRAILCLNAPLET
jgi:hypothetical protein